MRSHAFVLLCMAGAPGCATEDAPGSPLDASAGVIASPQPQAVPPPEASRSPRDPAPNQNQNQNQNKTSAAAKPVAGPELADLDSMCAAVDNDYRDGTLSDYFSGLTCKTSWCEPVRRQADESTTPGRTLMAAAIAAGLRVDDQRVPACARLFDYLDDVE